MTGLLVILDQLGRELAHLRAENEALRAELARRESADLVARDVTATGRSDV